MKRREFITLLGSAAAAWPLAARAHQPAMPVIGFLDTRSPEAMTDRLRAWRQGLQDTGHVEGETVRSSTGGQRDGHFDRLPGLAADLVRRQVTVIATGGGIAPAQPRLPPRPSRSSSRSPRTRLASVSSRALPDPAATSQALISSQPRWPPSDVNLI
jgi:hypothetical protein